MNLCGFIGQESKEDLTIDFISLLFLNPEVLAWLTSSSIQVVKLLRAGEGQVSRPEEVWMRQFTPTAPTLSTSSNSLRIDRSDWLDLVLMKSSASMKTGQVCHEL